MSAVRAFAAGAPNCAPWLYEYLAPADYAAPAGVHDLAPVRQLLDTGTRRQLLDLAPAAPAPGT